MSWSEDEEREYLELLELEAAETEDPEPPPPLLDYVQRVSPRYQRPEHLARVASLFDRHLAGEEVRALISVPPRFGKTELLLHGACEVLEHHPEQTVGYASYAANLARSKSRTARGYARSRGVRLAGDANALGEWRTTAGGGMLAAGVGGGWSGFGVNVLNIDDPHKNREEAESLLKRDNVYEWFQSTASTRVEPGGSILVCHTRWHLDDLIGRLSAERGTPWEVISLPAVDASGESIWPERWSTAALRAKRSIVGEYEWHALFLQNPIPRGGKVFRGPSYYEALDLRGCRVVLACDPAGTESTRSDHTAAVALAFRPALLHLPGCTGWAAVRGERCCYPLPRADVVDVLRGQWEPDRSAKELLAFQARHGHAPLVIEASRDGKSIARALREIESRLLLTEKAPRGDKFVRAQPVASAWNEGRVRVPTRAPWLADFLQEVADFTGAGDKADDQVDALAWAWAAGAAGGGTAGGTVAGL